MEEVGVREPGEGELLVEMAATGVCHTDSLIGELPGGAAPIAFYPRVLGHEGGHFVLLLNGHTYADTDQAAVTSKKLARACQWLKLATLCCCPSLSARAARCAKLAIFLTASRSMI